jgi:hypothetical protein
MSKGSKKRGRKANSSHEYPLSNTVSPSFQLSKRQNKQKNNQKSVFDEVNRPLPHPTTRSNREPAEKFYYTLTDAFSRLLYAFQQYSEAADGFKTFPDIQEYVGHKLGSANKKIDEYWFSNSTIHRKYKTWILHNKPDNSTILVSHNGRPSLLSELQESLMKYIFAFNVIYFRWMCSRN